MIWWADGLLKHCWTGITGRLSDSSIMSLQSRTLWAVCSLLSCHLLSLSPPRLPVILSARVEPVSRSACDHGAGPPLSGQAANDIILHHEYVCLWRRGWGWGVTPLVTVTHYRSHPPHLCSESDLIVVVSVCCTGNRKICALYLQDLSVFFFFIIILKYKTHSAKDRKKHIYRRQCFSVLSVLTEQTHM